MVRLRDPAGQSNLEFDPFANPESKSNCYYIDLGYYFFYATLSFKTCENPTYAYELLTL